MGVASVNRGAVGRSLSFSSGPGVHGARACIRGGRAAGEDCHV